MSVVVCFCCCFAFPPNRSDENSNDEMKCFVIVLFSLLLFGWMMVDLIWPISSLSYIFRLSFSLRCFRAVVIVVVGCLPLLFLFVCVCNSISFVVGCVCLSEYYENYMSMSHKQESTFFSSLFNSSRIIFYNFV